MRLKCIGCEVLARPLYWCAARSPHIIDIELLKRGLHDRPANLRDYLQAAIDSASGQGYQAVLMAYGLCGQATAGLIARQIPLVIPRAHDCITLFLGSRGRYQDQFTQYPGTYWYVQDYIEREGEPGSALALGAGSDTDLQAVYQEYVEKYGQDNADYLMEVMGAWQQHYQRAVFIDMKIGDGSAVEARAQEEAKRRGWTFERLVGELSLLRRLLDAEWDQDFLVLESGGQILMTHDDRIVSDEGYLPK